MMYDEKVKRGMGMMRNKKGMGVKKMKEDIEMGIIQDSMNKIVTLVNYGYIQ